MKSIFYLLLTIILLAPACDRQNDLEPTVALDPTPYPLDWGAFPPPTLPADNPLTLAGVQLGRMLFYEKQLSKDGSQACADCHQQADAFSDIRRFSIGVAQQPGKRQAMPIFNLAWHRNGLFWDGRAATLREQALRPIQDPLEMNETLENVVTKLKTDEKYRDPFIRAFGDAVVSSERVGLALEQFMLTMISNNSRFDQYNRGLVTLTPEEEHGRYIFFAELDPVAGEEKGGACFQCHTGFNFSANQYMNNGLDDDAGITDEGRAAVTHNPADRGRFKVPSLRNVALTAPYMHDGRFATLEEAIEHYNTGVKASATVDPLMRVQSHPGGVHLKVQAKADLAAFLRTLTDEAFVGNAEFGSPF